MSSPSPTSTSIPLKKRLPESLNQGLPKPGHDEQAAAAAALASLATSPKTSSVMERTKPSPNDESDGNLSDSEASYSSQNSVIPKPVHAPPLNSMMVDHTYIDYSVIDEKSLAFLEEGEDFQSKLTEEEKKEHTRRVQKVKHIFGDVGPSKKNSGGVVKPFPEKLMEVLDRPDMEAIITWMPHGRAFVVLQPQQLRDNVLPRFFKQTKFMSFTRQLNLWGFKRITKGDDSGAYYHELFLRGRPRLAMLMRRQKIKGTGIKLTPNPETEPNFYKISEKRPLPAIDPSKRKNKPLPPLRHNPQARPFDTASNVLDYDRMVQRLNSRPAQQDFDQQQIYPFSNNSSNLGGMASMNNGPDMNANQQNSFPGLSAGQGMNNGFNGHLNQNSLAGLAAAQGFSGGMNGGMNSNMNESLALQQLLLRQQLQQSNNPLAGLMAAQQGMGNGMNSGMNDSLSLQQLLLRHQLQSTYRDADPQQMQIAAAQRLLSQVNGPSSMGGDNIQDLKQSLLNAANSLDSINQQQPQHDPFMQQFSSNPLLASLLAQQQQQQQSQNNPNVQAILRALQQSRTGGQNRDHSSHSDNSNSKRPSF